MKGYDTGTLDPFFQRIDVYVKKKKADVRKQSESPNHIIII
jgi:hypothetical protein